MKDNKYLEEFKTLKSNMMMKFVKRKCMNQLKVGSIIISEVITT